jgi:hypothetical protein
MNKKTIGLTAGTREPLRPELRRYLHDGGLFKHPLAVQYVYDVADCGQLHKWIDHKQGEVQKCIRKGDWSHLLWLHERWYRFIALHAHAQFMNDKVFWRCFGEVWNDSEDIRGNGWIIRDLLDKNRPHREEMMSKKERRALQQLPETITIYRGSSYPNAKKGWSWTFSLRHAKWFAKRFDMLSGSPATVAVGEARKKDVLALLKRGDGGTVVIDPSKVVITKLFREKDTKSKR